MAACGSLDHMFKKPLPDNETLLESLSPWKQTKHNLQDSSYTETFGELHFKENYNNHFPESPSPVSPLLQSSPSSSASSASSLYQEIHKESAIDTSNKEENESPDNNERGTSPIGSYYHTRKQYRHSGSSFSSMSSESLSMCTEGLGFESSDDVEEFKNDNISFDFHGHQQGKISISEKYWKGSSERSRSKGSFPPPISCIGKTGRPWFCFKSYREDGRFILQEIRVPTQEFLHACREDGRLKLQLIQSDHEEEEDGNKICDFGELKNEENGEKDEHIRSNIVGE